METSASLLHRVRDTRDHEAWDRFVELYYPLLCFWARRAGVADSDIPDFTQDVFTHLLDKLPSFEYAADRGSFRRWLQTVALNKWRERCRKASVPVSDAPDAVDGVADADPVERFIDEDHHRYLVVRSLQLMKSDFEEATWQACWQIVVEGLPASEVADQLGMSVGSVYVAKSRVLHRLRTELEGML